jgi:hypothetical protein
MRMAQARARNRPAPLQLPPLENMHAVQSALTQVMEALASDMIDPRRAQGIVSLLRVAANNLKRPDAWRASEYRNDGAESSVTSYDDFETEFGLPKNLDLDIPPEDAFPPQPEAAVSELSSRAAGEGSAFPPGGPQLPDLGNCGESDPSTAIPKLDFPITAVDMELDEINRTQGPRAMIKRADEVERNRVRAERRRKSREAYQRYSVLAYNRTIQLTAEKMVAEKLAAERAAAEPPAKKPPASAVTDAPESTPVEAKVGS